MPLSVRSQTGPQRANTLVQDENKGSTTTRPSVGKSSSLQTPRRALGDLGNKQVPGGSTVKRGFGKDLTNQTSQVNNGSVKKRTHESTKENHGSIRKHNETTKKKGLRNSRPSQKTPQTHSPSRGVTQQKITTTSITTVECTRDSAFLQRTVLEKSKPTSGDFDLEYAPPPSAEAEIEDPITADHTPYMDVLTRPFEAFVSLPGPPPGMRPTAGAVRNVCVDVMSSDDDTPSVYEQIKIAAGAPTPPAPSLDSSSITSDPNLDEFEVTL